jgi:hypothetical protein
VATKSDQDALLIASAERHIESELPTQRLSLSEAQVWLASVAHSEDLDPPSVSKGQLSRCTDGVAIRSHHAIIVSSSRPSKLTLLHELAHLMGSMGHGPHFQALYEGLIRRHLSFQHALLFQEGARS